MKLLLITLLAAINMQYPEFAPEAIGTAIVLLASIIFVNSNLFIKKTKWCAK